jgi:hypothetical protein
MAWALRARGFDDPAKTPFQQIASNTLAQLREIAATPWYRHCRPLIG